MDKSQNNPATDAREAQIQADAERALPQPTSSLVSAIANGIGNGATAGLATYSIPKAIAALRHKAPPADNLKTSLAVTAVGTVLGAWYGLHEAKQLEKYRDSVAEEIVRVRDRVRVLEGKHHSHVEKLHAGREKAVEHADEITR